MKDLKIEFVVDGKAESDFIHGDNTCECFKEAEGVYNELYKKRKILPQFGDWVNCDHGEYLRVCGAMWHDSNLVTYWLDTEIR